jgi:hypothetical protein
MKLISFLPAIFILGSSFHPGDWIADKQKGYTLYTTGLTDKATYIKYIDQGIKDTRDFFHSSFISTFNIFVHPNRQSLDSAWQKDWNTPDFKSACWMVASGTGNKLDLLALSEWKQQACEHDPSDTRKMQQLIIHELIHVYHGQQNPSPDFSDVTGIDWFVEGLATYAAGQCDDVRVAEVKKAIADQNLPHDLSKFWTGNLKYGLSGSLVKYIDMRYGRKKLITLMKFKNLEQILSTLQTTEQALIDDWKKNVVTW